MELKAKDQTDMFSQIIEMVDENTDQKSINILASIIYDYDFKLLSKLDAQL